MTPVSAPNILVVGAGTTGLTAAVELARHGIIADVIDKKDAPSMLSRAVGILPSSMAALEPSGVAAAIRQKAVELESVIFHNGPVEVARLRLDTVADPTMRLLALAQDQTERLLCEALGRYSTGVSYSSALDNLEPGPDKVVVEINGKRQSYDYVIAADGTHSTVRRALGLAYSGIDLPEDWSIADVDAEGWPDPKAFKAFFLPHGSAAIVVPLEAARFRVIGNSVDAIAMLPVAMKIVNMRRSGSFKISVRQVERYQSGRVFLAGDAAHCHSPVGGRGMNLGISDATDLARRFVSGELEGYHGARHPVGAQVLNFSERGRGFVMSKSALKRRLLMKAVQVAAAVPFVGRRVVHGLLSG